MSAFLLFIKTTEFDMKQLGNGCNVIKKKKKTLMESEQIVLDICHGMV